VLVLRRGRELGYALKFIPIPPTNSWGHAQKIVEVDNIFRVPRHPNIIKYYGWFQLENWAVVGMELCDGTLSDFWASNEFRSLPFRQQQRMNMDIIYQLSQGLDELHRHGLMHRDIKPDNGSTHLSLPK
jgi:serine/threonine protein kinase